MLHASTYPMSTYRRHLPMPMMKLCYRHDYSRTEKCRGIDRSYLLLARLKTLGERMQPPGRLKRQR